MAKRSATTVLNHENWDQEEESEEQGTFQRADDETLKNRVIKTAKRRRGSLSPGGGSKAGAFSGFSGFGNTEPPSGSSPFSFLSQNKKSVSEGRDKLEEESGSTKADPAKETDKKSQNLEILKDLNLSCNSWITEHLEKNPYCILTPIFRDYEKHLAQLDLETESEKKENTFKLPLANAKNDSRTMFLFSKEPAEAPLGAGEKQKLSQLKSEKEIPKLQFDGPKNSLPFTGFFPASPASKEGTTINLNVGGNNQKEGDEEEEEESNEPPKSDFTPVVEEGSLYDKRCKIFFKKDSNFIAKGVGTLFLKPVKEGKNTQLIVRADTSSGNIILNILLTPSLPVQKTGKNNIMIVCIPTPECKPPPIPVLIRVKTSEDCEEVIKKLEQYKGS